MTKDREVNDVVAVVVADHWDLIIRPHRKWFDLKLGELWRYRDLVMLFVRRDAPASPSSFSTSDGPACPSSTLTSASTSSSDV